MSTELKVWAHTTFKGHWPVGTGAVVIAPTREDAATYLDDALAKNGLAQEIDPAGFLEVPLKDGAWRILCDGNY